MTTLTFSQKPPTQPHIFIGKGSRDYNPFCVGTAEENLGRFRKYFFERVSFDREYAKRIESFRNKLLWCNCGNVVMCHGMVYLEYLGKDKS